MKTISSKVVRAAAICALTLIGAAASARAQYPQSPQPQYPSGQQDPSRGRAQDVPGPEREALTKINTAPDAQTKLQLAGEFVKKFPKSIKRAELAAHVGGEIAKVQDNAQQITLLETFLTVFDNPNETQMATLGLIDAYIKASRFDDAFRLAGTHLEKDPNDVAALTRMAILATEQAKANNPKFVQQAIPYGTKAIELIEADKRPASIDAAMWTEYKTTWLPLLCQSTGILALLTGNKVEAKDRLEKAASLNASDPVTYMLLGGVIDGDYQQLAIRYKEMPSGPAKEDTLKQAHAKLDEVIELFAHAIGLAEGDPKYKNLYDGLMPGLESYYKYRHNGSVDGLQQLIGKYKKTTFTLPQ
ncbi:MAG TPA: hypothetical protein VJH03_05785 [Blastocatellia bacterium]|nr:hypothetical protein [Blastocatellia bacterium]